MTSVCFKCWNAAVIWTTIIKFYMVVVILQLLVVLYTGLMILRELKLYKFHCTVDVTKHYFANSVINVWNSLPDTVVMAPSLLSFRHQLAKFDLSSFCVNFWFLILFLYILFRVITVYCAHCFYVFSMYFIGVSGLRVLPLLINGWILTLTIQTRHVSLFCYITRMEWT